VFIVIAATGIYLDSGGRILGFDDLAFGMVGIPLTIFAVIGLINAFNMLDGIDGLAASIAMTSIAAMLLFAQSGSATPGVVMLLQVLFVALFPYLLANLGWPDGRKIFMGDAGSTLIGFLLGWSLIFLSHRGVSPMAPVDALWCVALPVMDTLAVMLRRVRQGRSPFKPDRQHLHHLLLDAGCAPRMALLLMVGAAVALALVGYGLRNVPETVSLALFGAVLGFYVLRFDRPLELVRRAMRGQALRRAQNQRSGARAAVRGADAAPPLRALCVISRADAAARMAPIVRKLIDDPRFAPRVCLVDAGSDPSTARLLELFDIQPAVHLDLPANSDAGGATPEALHDMKRVLDAFAPELVLVPGHAPAAVAATLAAFAQGIPVACIATSEGGRGSSQLRRDADRRIIESLAVMHLVQGEGAAQSLRAEGVPAERIAVIGNTALHTLRAVAEFAREDHVLRAELGERLGFLRSGSPLLLVADARTTSRGFEALGRAMRKLASAQPQCDIVYATDPAAEAVTSLGELLRADPRMHAIPQDDVFAFAYLLDRAHLSVAVSRDTAAELEAMGRPVLLVPGEQAEGSAGSDGLQAGIHEDGIASAIARVLSERQKVAPMASTRGADVASCDLVPELLARLRDGSAARSGVHATQGARTAQALREAS
jgi:UDP-N-acetylglucosamine 2-epimerase